MNLHPLSLVRAIAAASVTLLFAACGSTDSAGGATYSALTDASNGDGSLTGADGSADAMATDDATADTASNDTTAGTDATGGTDATSQDSAADTGPSIDDMPCPSGQKYTYGTGNDMEPGNACIQCHGQQGGPSYKIAGTVFRNLITESGCYASGKAGSVVPPASYTVEITDANGKVFKTSTSTLSGNFHMSGKAMTGFTPPYSARVLDAAGNERKMAGKQTSGDCNSCHTATGANAAPGRIVAPSVP
jgi:hypothetical protein